MPPNLVEWLALRTNVRPWFARFLLGQGVALDAAIADVGSGEGALLAKMARCGFTNLSGIDPFLHEDRQQGPIHLRRAHLEDLSESYDVIMFNHSLEHVLDPLATLASARDRLNGGGTVIVRIPILGFAWDKYGSNWVGLDPPRHTFVPSHEGFLLLAERAGFDVTRVFFDSTPLQFQGSERYERDIPLVVPDSQVPDDVLEMERRNSSEWWKLARRLNRERSGDNAGFVLKPQAVVSRVL